MEDEILLRDRRRLTQQRSKALSASLVASIYDETSSNFFWGHVRVIVWKPRNYNGRGTRNRADNEIGPNFTYTLLQFAIPSLATRLASVFEVLDEGSDRVGE
jgi:hypothetical protein